MSQEGVNGAGPALEIPIGIVVDVENARAFVVDEKPALYSIDLATGDRVEVSGLEIPPRPRP